MAEKHDTVRGLVLAGGGAARRGPPTLFFIIYSLFFFLFAPLTLKFLITNF